jgi:uncharacterized protein YllA (UPF0747 family)
MTLDLTRGGALARERFPVRWDDDDALRALAEAKRAPLAPALVGELDGFHRRLGASAASLESLARLARGEAVVAIAGQQPAPLGGPLYSLHKIASTVGLAAAVTARTGVPCVPVFWVHDEDSDFAEIRGALAADARLALRELELAADLHRDGGLVGDIPVAPVAALEREALGLWAGLPGERDAAALLEHSHARARDLGEAAAALMLALFADQGLLVMEPRLPAFRHAARRIVDRYLERPSALGAAARAAGDRLEAAGARRALSDAALESFVFAIEDGVRHKVDPAAAAAAPVLSPSVALRPAVQDGVLPTVAMAVGPGEIAYLAQLREVFEGVGVRPACPVPRFSATWLPPGAGELLAASGADAWELVAAADQVLRHHAERQVPPEVSAPLDESHRAALEGLARFSTAAARLDPSLPQMVESARGKVDYQYQRLREGVAAKARHQLDRRHPEWSRLRYYLAPGDKLQERRLAGFEVVAYRGRRVAAEVSRLAFEHAQALARGTWRHALLEL